MLDFTSIFNLLVENSVATKNKIHIRMKPLETGRQMFAWFCSDAIDEPLNKYQVLARRIFRYIFLIFSVATSVVTNVFLLSSVNGVDDFFFGIFQFTVSMDAMSGIIAIFVSGSKLASVFRNLENIYNACKNLL